MRIVCISDTHGMHDALELPAGDVLVHAGDMTAMGRPDQVAAFGEWLQTQSYAHKVVIAGNHDWMFVDDRERAVGLLGPDVIYLQDSGCQIEGLEFWGSPWQPEFFDWAFNLPRKGPELRELWARIPESTDVLVTHGPPYGTRDACPDFATREMTSVGCELLRDRLGALSVRAHVFGHIHEGHGLTEGPAHVSVNASICDGRNRVGNEPIVIEL